MPTVLTIGHSTRTLEELIHALRAHGVTRVVDVRAFPRSRRNPRFNVETLPQSLAAAGIGYVHLPEVGGRRRPQPGSTNAGWHNASFRAYADYMQTPEFATSLETLIGLAECERIALLCAEAVPWRCHRRLIADALVARGIPVEHILSAGRTQTHVLPPWARVEGVRVTYPAEEAPTDGEPGSAEREAG